MSLVINALKKTKEGAMKQSLCPTGGWVGLGCDTLSRLVRRTVISTVVTFDVGPECWEEAARQRAVGRILQALKIWQVQRASGREELGR